MAGLYPEFLAQIMRNGVSKTSHFQVSIPLIPDSLRNNIQFESGRLLALRCEATDLPGRQLVTQDSRIYGPVYKTPYQSVYQEVTLNFLETHDMFIRRFFELWINSVFNAATNRLTYPNSYRIDVSVTQFDVSANDEESLTTSPKRPGASTLAPLLTWHLISAFPTAVNQMPVSWTEDGFHRVSVTLAYEYYLLSTPSEPKDKIKPGGLTTKTKQGSAT